MPSQLWGRWGTTGWLTAWAKPPRPTRPWQRQGGGKAPPGPGDVRPGVCGHGWACPETTGLHTPCHGPGKARKPGRGDPADATARLQCAGPAGAALLRPWSSHRSRPAEMEGSSWQNKQEREAGPPVRCPATGRSPTLMVGAVSVPAARTTNGQRVRPRGEDPGLRQGPGQGSAGTPTALAEDLRATSSRRPASRTARGSAMARARLQQRGALCGAVRARAPRPPPLGYLALQGAPGSAVGAGRLARGLRPRPAAPGPANEGVGEAAARRCTAQPGPGRGPARSPQPGTGGAGASRRVCALDGLVPSPGSFSCPPATARQDEQKGVGEPFLSTRSGAARLPVTSCPGKTLIRISSCFTEKDLLGGEGAPGRTQAGWGP